MDGELNVSLNIHSTTIPVVTHHQRLIVGVILLIIAVFGILGNSLVIFAVFTSQKLRTFTNIFVVNLSVADLLTSLLIPFQCVVIFSADDSIPIPNWACGVIGATTFICVGCSLYTLASIGTYRFILLTDSSKRRCQKLHNVYYAVAWIGLTWIVPLLVNIVPHAIGAGHLGFNEKYHACGAQTSHRRHRELEIAQTFGMYTVPFVIILVSYSLIFKTIRQHTRHMSRNTSVKFSERQRQIQVTITKNMFYVVLAFIICLTPYAICLVLPHLNGQLYAAPFVTANSCINPFLYGFKHPDFREVFNIILTCKWNKLPEPSRGLRLLRRFSTSEL